MTSTEYKIGVVGNGFVGRATQQLANNKDNLLVYDINPSLCHPQGTSLREISHCDLVFVCVPTPMNSDYSVHINIVADVVNKLKSELDSRCYIIVRSSVPPSTCQSLGVYFMPEFLTERNYQQDFYQTSPWIIGSDNSGPCNHTFKQLMQNVLFEAKQSGKISSDKIEWMTTPEAEMVKYFRNTFLATKVAFCNEIEEFCRAKSISYKRISSIACDDPRITSSHSAVPGPDGKRGFGGTCFPKDCHGLRQELLKQNLTPLVLSSVIKRNETIDRSEKDWLKDRGRTTI